MKQLRNTRQRQIVLDTVKAHGDHPSADQLYLDVRALDPKISLGTVYRNLKVLSKRGDIQHINVSGVERFDWRCDPHAHLICTECGSLCDAPLPYDTKLDQLLSEQTGYEISFHRTVFEGRCPACVKGRK